MALRVIACTAVCSLAVEDSVSQRGQKWSQHPHLAQRHKEEAPDMQSERSRITSRCRKWKQQEKKRMKRWLLHRKTLLYFLSSSLWGPQILTSLLCDPRETGPQNIQQQFGSILHKSVEGHGRNMGGKMRVPLGEMRLHGFAWLVKSDSKHCNAL